MKITRLYTTAGQDPFTNIKFVQRTSKIVNPNGSVIFEMNDVWAPEHWSQVAVDILAQKYLRKAGVPTVLKKVEATGTPEWLQRSVPLENGTKYETTQETDARQVFHRMAGCWTFWGWKGKYFTTEEDAKAFYDETCFMLAMQYAAPNSPQWFNTGLHWAYGIGGPAQGHYYVDPDMIECCKISGMTTEASINPSTKESKSAYERPQPHACFIQGIKDNLVNEGGIMDLWVKEARIFKYGSGTGSNMSDLRGDGEPLSGGGKSSGLMSWLGIGDRSAGAIKCAGTTRRAAVMRILDLDHPDI